jgi:hypothetical protein
MAYHLFLHRPDKAITIAPPRLDQPLRLPTIPKRLARQLDATLQGGIADALPGPQLGAEHALRDQMGALL